MGETIVSTQVTGESLYNCESRDVSEMIEVVVLEVWASLSVAV